MMYMYFLHTCYLQIWHTWVKVVLHHSDCYYLIIPRKDLYKLSFHKSTWTLQKIMLNGIICIINILDVQLLVQSVSITTKVVSSNPGYVEVYSIQHCVIKFAQPVMMYKMANEKVSFTKYLRLLWAIHDTSISGLSVSLLVKQNKNKSRFPSYVLVKRK
jgi:hypothetical protein